MLCSAFYVPSLSELSLTLGFATDADAAAFFGSPAMTAFFEEFFHSWLADQQYLDAMDAKPNWTWVYNMVYLTVNCPTVPIAYKAAHPDKTEWVEESHAARFVIQVWAYYQVRPDLFRLPLEYGLDGLVKMMFDVLMHMKHKFLELNDRVSLEDFSWRKICKIRG